jgi:hypothetical protein
MDLGTVGNAIIFFFSLIGGIIVFLYFLLYAANCLLVVLQGTAAGMDEVPWPDEPVFDWLLRSLFLVGLGLLWLAPAGILARGLRQVLLPEQPLLRFALLAGVFFWLIYPVSVLSTLVGTNRLVLLRWRVLRALWHLFPATLGFYFFSALLVAVVGITWYWALLIMPMLLPLPCVLTGAAVLIYARLLGRIGWLIGRHEDAVERAAARARAAPDKRKPSRPRRRKGPLRGVKVEDPWAEPPAQPESRPEPSSRPRPSYLPPPLHEMKGYGFADEDAPRQEPRPKPKSRFAPTSPYEVEGYDVRPEPPAPPPLVPQSEYEKSLLAPPTPPYVPARPLFSGVWTFPIYSGCHTPWARIAVWCFLWGMMLLSILSHFGGLGVG